MTEAGFEHTDAEGAVWYLIDGRPDWGFKASTPPALPFRGHGVSTGWASPTKWAIDADGRCWLNCYRNVFFEKKDWELLSGAEGSDRAHIRDLLGLPVEEPSWMEPLE